MGCNVAIVQRSPSLTSRPLSLDLLIGLSLIRVVVAEESHNVVFVVAFAWFGSRLNIAAAGEGQA